MPARPRYTKLNRMAPKTHDHNLVVKVLEKRTIVDKTLETGRRVREEMVLVADDTGCMNLHVRDSNCDKLVVGEVVALHKAKVNVIKQHLRLEFDKWGSIHSTTIAIPGGPQTDPNFSEIVYNRAVEEWQ